MQSEIKITVELDEHKVPEKLFWTAEDGGIEKRESKAIFLSVWDDVEKELLKIDLWTKEMPLDDMKKFYHQILHTMATTYQRASNEDDVAGEIAKFAEEFAFLAKIKS